MKISRDKVMKALSEAFIIFILVQPIFDIIAFFRIRVYEWLDFFSYVKIIIMVILSLSVFIFDKKKHVKNIIYYILYFIAVVIHVYLLYNLQVQGNVLLMEIKILSNILYMLVLIDVAKILYDNAENKEDYKEKVINAIVIAMITLSSVLIITTFTGTSARTYEYSDPNKPGFKGWLDSGQIFGHSLCICLPLILNRLLRFSSDKLIVKILVRFLIVIPVAALVLIGTKVTYFMCLAILAIMTLLYIGRVIKKKKLSTTLNFIYILAVCLAVILLYKKLPVATNVNLTLSAKNEDTSYITEETPSYIDLEYLNKISEKVDEMKVQENNTKYEEIENYYAIEKEALDAVQKKYVTGELKPTDTRNIQITFSYIKWSKLDWKYKLFGMGYMNEPGAMAVERDFFMALFCLGIIPFILIFSRLFKILVLSIIRGIKNIKKINTETFALFEGFCIFFIISMIAGATYIYTNFSIFLVLIVSLLDYNTKKLSVKKEEKQSV